MAFLKGLAFSLVAVSVVWFALNMIAMNMNQCGDGYISLPVAGYGIACVQAKHWEPRP